jgi:hypothetical protein
MTEFTPKSKTSRSFDDGSSMSEDYDKHDKGVGPDVEERIIAKLKEFLKEEIVRMKIPVGDDESAGTRAMTTSGYYVRDH